MIFVCEECGEEYVRDAYLKDTTKFCSNQCKFLSYKRKTIEIENLRKTLSKSIKRKTCSMCRIDQPIENYTLVPKGKDGHSARCKLCCIKSGETKRKQKSEYLARFKSIKKKDIIPPKTITIV